MEKRFQITTFEGFSQFSRVADQSIITGLSENLVRKHWTAHLSVEEQLRVSVDLQTKGWSSFQNRHDKLARILQYEI